MPWTGREAAQLVAHGELGARSKDELADDAKAGSPYRLPSIRRPRETQSATESKRMPTRIINLQHDEDARCRIMIVSTHQEQAGEEMESSYKCQGPRRVCP